MHESLQDLYRKQDKPTKDMQMFLENLEVNIGNDLWKSAGGIWSDSSVQRFRETAMLKLAQHQKASNIAPKDAWINVIRDFHNDQPRPFWGETRLAKKEKKPQSEEQRIFWELFTYIWAAAQALLITKTIILYFGINAALDEDNTAKGWMYATIAFSFTSLCFFAYRQSRKNKPK